MKIHTQTFLIVCLSMLVFCAKAQSEQHQQLSPTERAQKEMARYKTDLSLSADQEKQIQPILLKYANQEEQVKTANQGNHEAAKSQFMALREKKDAELKTILTETQYQKLQAIRAEHKNHGGGH